MVILKEIGEEPVLLKKEILGFALNRMQYALMNECWRLVEVCYVTRVKDFIPSVV